MTEKVRLDMERIQLIEDPDTGDSFVKDKETGSKVPFPAKAPEIYKSSTKPSDPSKGDIWVDNNRKISKDVVNWYGGFDNVGSRGDVGDDYLTFGKGKVHLITKDGLSYYEYTGLSNDLGGAILDGDYLYVGDINGNLHKVDVPTLTSGGTDSESQEWTNTLSSGVHSLVLWDGDIYAGCNGEIKKIDPSDGTVTWSYTNILAGDILIDIQNGYIYATSKGEPDVQKIDISSKDAGDSDSTALIWQDTSRPHGGSGILALNDAVFNCGYYGLLTKYDLEGNILSTREVGGNGYGLYTPVKIGTSNFAVREGNWGIVLLNDDLEVNDAVSGPLDTSLEILAFDSERNILYHDTGPGYSVIARKISNPHSIYTGDDWI